MDAKKFAKFFIPAFIAVANLSEAGWFFRKIYDEKIYDRKKMNCLEHSSLEDKKKLDIKETIRQYDYEFAHKFYTLNPSPKAFTDKLISEGAINHSQAELVNRATRHWPLMVFHGIRITKDPTFPLFDFVLTCTESKFLDIKSSAGAITPWQLMPETIKILVSAYGKDPFLNHEDIIYDPYGNIIWISDENAIILHCYYLRDIKRRLGFKDFYEGAVRIYNAYVFGTNGNRNLERYSHIDRFIMALKNLDLIEYIEEFIEIYQRDDWHQKVSKSR